MRTVVFLLTFMAIGLSAFTSAALAGDTESVVWPSIYETDSLRDIVLEGITLTVEDRFATAESLFVRLDEAYPESPVGPLFAAAAIHAEMLDLESPYRHREFTRWLELAIARAQTWRNAEPFNGEPEFLLGAAYGYDAVYESRWGGWFAALKKALRSRSRCADALKKDSTLIDAYLGIGNYNYWKSVKTDFINWLPVVADDRRKGLAQLHRAAVRGLFSRSAARASLCWALIHEEDYQTALAHADTLRMEHPNARGPLWITAHANFGLYRWEDAFDFYDQIVTQILADGPGNYYNLIECAYYQAYCLYQMGRWRDALDVCRRGIAYPAPKTIKDRQSGKLKKLRSLRRELVQLLADG